MIYDGDIRLESSNRKSCLSEADRLKRENGSKGEVYYVTHFKDEEICHAYYLPDLSKKSDFALNQINFMWAITHSGGNITEIERIERYFIKI